MKSGNQVRENSADTGELSIFIEKDPTSSEFRSELEELHDRATIRNPYFSPEWLIAWLARQPDEIRPFLLLARTGQGRLDGFWPFVERPGLLGSKGLWPFVYDEANYFDPVATPEGAKALVKGMKAQLKGFLFCCHPKQIMRDMYVHVHRSGLSSLLVGFIPI